MATISEDYVSFETAKLLKEKGFDCRCACINHPRCGMSLIGHMINNTDLQLTREYELCIAKENFLTIPTIQMVVKWLVQKYRLYVNVVPSVEGYYWTEKWHSYVEDLNKRYPFGRFINTFNSPEEAYEATIKYCLEHLI